MKAGYHQVEVAEKDIEKTAFSYGWGYWQFKVMPVGLCNAPATFEHLMDRVLEGLHWQTALIYLDDVIVFGQIFDQEFKRLSEVFNKIRAAHLKLNPKKCHLFQKEVKYLGHIVSDSGVHTDPEKVSAVKDWPAPTCVKDLRSFLGFCAYYWHFIKDFASIATPLHKLLGKRQKFEWTAVTQKAFDQLKQALVSSPVWPGQIMQHSSG
ncbi:hypothetical protein Pcinc_002634 [Petrolisthes cinctipes]|uniref:RNA-directed DNA polymerase n=1 Tax=Petrolisthes cinctipes TaxID=88211 RepID=A0AAE1KWU6_PETCI|nr:hypothetical protein Pcinc_008885 [Petrolisthes cinctipes]KAK3893569.1 hypothetical protein Pcinc_002634 [Petrolisthes cinctipes]